MDQFSTETSRQVKMSKTIEEIQRLKCDLETNIAEQLMTFQNTTKVKVAEINISTRITGLTREDLFVELKIEL